MIEVQSGESFNLTALLYDGATNKFVRARLYDANFIELTNSPFTLNHVSDGLYLNSSEIASAEGLYYLVAEIYDDAGFNTLSIDYAKGEEVFLVTDREQQYETINNNIDSGEGQAF